MAEEAFFTKRFQEYYQQLKEGCQKPNCQNPYCRQNWSKLPDWNDELKLSSQAQLLASDFATPHFCQKDFQVKLQARGPTGGRTTLSLSPVATLSQLLDQTAKAFSIPVNSQKLLHGFPPTEVVGFLEQTLSEIQIQQPTDTLIVERVQSPFYLSVSHPSASGSLVSPPSAAPPAQSISTPSSSSSTSSTPSVSPSVQSSQPSSSSTKSSSASKPTPPETISKTTSPPPVKLTPTPPPAKLTPTPTPKPSSSSSTISVSGRGATYSGFKLVRRIVPADNSCLFTSVGYVLMGGREKGRGELRNVIGRHISQHSDQYDEAVLSMPTNQYVDWIQNNENWGGAIECAILSSHFQTEIVVFDIETQKVYRYGEGSGYPQRVLLLYDGIHYDPLALTPDGSPTEEIDQTVFNVDDEEIVKLGQELTQLCHQQRKYTNTTNFSLRCIVCAKGLKGNKEASQHAAETGHTNFAEFAPDK